MKTHAHLLSCLPAFSLPQSRGPQRCLQCLFLLCLVPCMSRIIHAQNPKTGGPAADSQATALYIELPKPSKQQLEKIDKQMRKNYKRCAEALKDKAATGLACVAVVPALKAQPETLTLATAVEQRACGIGDAKGCALLGKDMAATGDLAEARKIWTNQTCSEKSVCLEELFASYANAPSPDLNMASRYGVPLCEKYDEEKICTRLMAMGVKLDYAAIEERRRQRKIENTKDKIAEANKRVDAANAGIALEQASLNVSTNGLVSLYHASMLRMYEKGLASAQSESTQLTQELIALQGSADGAPAATTSFTTMMMQGLQSASTANAYPAVAPTNSQPTVVPASYTVQEGTVGSDGPSYSGSGSAWVRRLLSTAGSYSCPSAAPAVPQTFTCARDGEVAKATRIAWAIECESRANEPDAATQLVPTMMATLRGARALCDTESVKADCDTNTTLPCNDLPGATSESSDRYDSVPRLDLNKPPPSPAPQPAEPAVKYGACGCVLGTPGCSEHIPKGSACSAHQ